MQTKLLAATSKGLVVVNKENASWKIAGVHFLGLPVSLVYVDERDIVWASDFGGNAVWRFDPSNEKFERFGFTREATSIRQILGRPGEVWLPEGGTEHLSVIRTAA